MQSFWRKNIYKFNFFYKIEERILWNLLGKKGIFKSGFLNALEPKKELWKSVSVCPWVTHFLIYFLILFVAEFPYVWINIMEYLCNSSSDIQPFFAKNHHIIISGDLCSNLMAICQSGRVYL